MRSIIAFLAILSSATVTAETVVHHGIVGHWENVGPCHDESLMKPKCEEGARYCETVVNPKGGFGMCTKVDGKCSRDGKGCVDIRWNRDVCVQPANECGTGYCGTAPNFHDCRCDVHGDGQCYKVEFVVHHDEGL